MFREVMKSMATKEPETGFIYEVTAACNNRCLYCYNVWKCHGRPTPGDLPASEWAKITGKLQRESSVRLITVSGGEPLLRKDLPEILGDIKARHINVNLITNGTLLTGDNVAGTIDSVSMYELPLLSDTAFAHDYLAQSKAFDKVIDGMANITAAGGNFAAVFVATRVNADDLEGACLMAIALGARTLMYNPFNPGGEGLRHMEKLRLPASTVKAHLDLLEELSRQYGIPVHCGVPVLPCVLDTREYKRITFGSCPAGGQGAYYTIDPQGMMRMCNHSPQVLGDFREEPFRKIKASAAAESFRRCAPERCRGCKDFPACRGGCRAILEQIYGRADVEEPLSGITQT
ncbi:radical SAM protein [Methanocella sp. MCL-LM]|uniref:radical SAM protein n=1 Tax=Methanocella sp. MCL-LM TaxID=3412035 RepID=UPI003C72E3F5